MVLLYILSPPFIFNNQKESKPTNNLSKRITFAQQTQTEDNRYEGKKTLDNPDDGNDTDCHSRFSGRGAYLRV